MSTLLIAKVDDQEQYSRRTCLVFEVLNNELSQKIADVARNELHVKISGDDIEKSHLIKIIKENRYIVKFTKHSTAETIYKQRKKLTKKKEDKTNHPIKIRVSLTSTAQKMTFSIKDFLSKCDQIHRKLRIEDSVLKILFLLGLSPMRNSLKQTKDPKLNLLSLQKTQDLIDKIN